MLHSPYPLPHFLPPPEHPRLMLRQKDLSRIRQNFSAYPAVAAQWQELCDYPVAGKGATPEYGTYHLKEYLAIEAKALRALLRTNREDQRAVVDELLFLLRTVSFEGGLMQARWGGHLIFVASEVYDWCYPVLTPDERTEVISFCETIAEQYFEMGYPPEKQAAISGHGNEAQLLRDLLAFSIAVYDERPDIYHFCAGRIETEYLPAYAAVFSGEFHPQGPTYGSYRHACALWCGLLFLSMGAGKIFEDSMEAVGDSFLYLTRSDGEALRLGDDCLERKAPYARKSPFMVPLFLSAAYSGRALHHREALRQLVPSYLIPEHYGMDYYREGSYGEGLISPSVFLIFDGLQPLRETAPLPVARYFGSPVGCTIYNDGERLVLMKIGELWGGNHDHLDTGCFQIYDGEILASDSGVYDRYGTAHHKNYLRQTAAHNCLTVAGKGTRLPAGGREAQNTAAWLAEYRMAQVIRHAESDALCEIEGDLSPAYAETCRSVTRVLRWEPNRADRGVLTVCDTVTPLEEHMDVTFHIHCQTAPQIHGNCIIIPGQNRELICRVLSPASVTICGIGGPGRQFELGGVPYEPLQHVPEEGWGRVEITARGKKVRFCVEMEIRKK